MSPWRRKPIWALDNNTNHNNNDSTESNSNHHNTIARHLSLWDLVAIGVGGTVGSGIFVLAGFVAHHYAGPSTFVSFAVAGMAACLSGLCFAELAGRLPSEGSTYVYAYVSMGEWPAVVAAACLTLEYGVSGAAVARSWGDKVVLWLTNQEEEDKEWVQNYLEPGYGINPMAFLVSVASVALLLKGVRESKAVTNFITVLKMALVIFMTVGGFLLFKRKNSEPLVVPSLGGASGILRGATSSFFGYLGYDEVCCLAGEAKRPRRDMPLAVILTLITVMALYILASLALTGMQPYDEMSDTSAFPNAFAANGVHWAAQLAATGEIITLPVVVLISLMAQPRLQYALAQDGLLPPIFGKLDGGGNLKWGIWISGSLMTALATFVPFSYLDDLISSGILLAFSMTDSSIILMRMSSPPLSHNNNKPHLLERLLVLFHILSLVTGLLITRSSVLDVASSSSEQDNRYYHFGSFLAALSSVATIATAACIAIRCPRRAYFGGVNTNDDDDDEEETYFQTPLVPYLPCMAIFVNWYLIAQLEVFGLCLLLVYIGLATLFYFCYGTRHSVGNTAGWGQDYQGVAGDSDDHHFGDDAILLRTISLPRKSYHSNGATSNNGIT